MRSYTFAFGLVSTLSLTAGALAFAACGSGGDDAAPSDADGSVEATSDAEAADAAPDGPTYAQCVADCQKAHPSGFTVQANLDSCWQARCPGPCVEGDGGFVPPDAGPPDAGPLDAASDGGVGDGGDAADVADAGSACGVEPVDTGNLICDECTAAYCCTTWTACELTAECAAYGTCLDACDALEEP